MMFPEKSGTRAANSPGHRLLAASLVVIAILMVPVVGSTAERRTPVVEVVEKAGPAVVNIRTEQVVKRRSPLFFGFDDPLFEKFFQEWVPSEVYRTQSLGSGVIIDPKGLILTNAHVIEKASKIFAALPVLQLGRQQELKATLVGKDENLDLAVLKIAGEETFPYLSPGRSDNLLMGETVIAIGNPLGLGHSITTGIVSAPRRQISVGDRTFATFIQTDALINPGNSGGPLLNINGDLIGINTAIVRQAQGIGFAIPIDTAKRVIDDLISFGRVRRAYLGVIPKFAGEAFVKSGWGGILVADVVPGSPADKAGIRLGDVILAIDDNAVTNLDELGSLLRSYTPDDTMPVSFLRGTTTQRLAIRLSEVPSNYGLRYSQKAFGLTVKDSRKGVTIQDVEAGSAAAEVGLKPGDIILEVEGQRLATVGDYAQVIEEFFARESVRFLIIRGNHGYYIELP